ncbi:MAG: DUF1134 domain-containing protein [Chromatiales bacterium]|jgi:hypothetical protein
MNKLSIVITGVLLLFATNLSAESKPEHKTYSKNEILQKAEAFFGEGAEGLAEVIEKAFDDHGEPNAYIVGDEVSAALGIGVRYGKGTLQTSSGFQQELYWQGPSIGFDAGANAAKTFVLIYHLPAAKAIFQRYPGVEGSLFFVGGVGMNYLRVDDTVVAPIRFGAGWRQGVNVGYMDFTREKSINPF